MTASSEVDDLFHNQVSDAYSCCKQFLTHPVSYRLFFGRSCLRQVEAASYPLDLVDNLKLAPVSG